MRTSSSTAQIDAVMARVQSELKPVQKNKSVEVDGPKAKWDSKYATLDVLYNACHEVLTRHGVAIYQGGGFVQGGGERLFTRLSFNGEWIESDFPVKVSRDGAQGFGGGVSFARRWGLCGMVGLVTEGDPDEKAGYQDERRSPRRAAAPPGLPAALESIRAASSHEEFAQRAATARAANSTGDAAAAVERQIDTWVTYAVSNARTLDELTLIRDLCRRVQPRGAMIREELRKAEARLMVGP